MNKMKSFKWGNKELPVEYVETMQVREGVECDVYAFSEDQGRDLGVVRVREGHKTPRQRVVDGIRTIEGFMSGAGILRITQLDKSPMEYVYPSQDAPAEVVVAKGQTMQWRATDSDLTFYEICEPPYQPGRYVDLTDEEA